MIPGLKDILDYHYEYFGKARISPDPLEFLHRYGSYTDIEAVGLISSVFAYGNVRQIIATLERITQRLSPSPGEFLKGSFEENRFSGLRHRFYSSDDITLFFLVLSEVYSRYGSLKELFLKSYCPDEKNLKSGISGFVQELLTIAEKLSGRGLTPGFRFMFPDPFQGSACKRMNLFLRWMVRRDELDFGLWSEIPASKLVIPVDTHIARISRELSLTKRKNVSWAMAEEITERLKEFDPLDPVKYDFAICHIGMRKLDSLSGLS